jgi:fructokinase
MPRFGGIEAGGTKFVCAVGSHPDDVEAVEFPTTTPEETIQAVAGFFTSRLPLDALGIGSFGPIDANPKSATFGYITSTPKLAWQNFDLAGTLREALQVPVAFDTDVNAAALAEFRWGAAQGLKTFLYVTVGTGVGGGAMVGGRLLHGRQHPEMGHIRVPHDRVLDPFPGSCPYHGDCLEGLIAAPALEARWGRPPRFLPPGHAAWDLFVHYLALGLCNWICTLSPEKVILGGGIMQHGELFPQLQARVAELLNRYLDPPDIVPPRLGDRAGVLGAIALAETALPASDHLHV